MEHSVPYMVESKLATLKARYGGNTGFGNNLPESFASRRWPVTKSGRRRHQLARRRAASPTRPPAHPRSLSTVEPVLDYPLPAIADVM